MSEATRHNRLTPQRAEPEQAARRPDEELVDMGRQAFAAEASALAAIGGRLGPSFARAVRMMLGCQGRILVTGLGKSGLIARKIAATLTSTGTPSIFVHPVEALHGDLGIATADDLVLALSNSGRNRELLSMVNSLRALGLNVVAITGDLESPLAGAADVVLDTTIDREVCPLDLTPTTSSTAMLVMGDALTVALLELRQFRLEDFAVFHPSGSLGHALKTTVSELMHTGDDLPVVSTTAPLRDAVLMIAEKRLGCSCVVDGDGLLTGFLTNGDLQRVLLHQAEASADPLSRPCSEFMSQTPRTVAGDCLARAALQQMEANPGGPITQLVVVEEGRPLGLIHLHDILGRSLVG